MLADACALRALLPQVVPGRQVGQARAAGGGRLQGQVDRPGPHSEPIHHSSGLLCRQLAAWLLGKVRRQTLVVCSCASEEQRRGSARRGRTRATPGAGTAGPTTRRRPSLSLLPPTRSSSFSPRGLHGGRRRPHPQPCAGCSRPARQPELGRAASVGNPLLPPPCPNCGMRLRVRAWRVREGEAPSWLAQARREASGIWGNSRDSI